MGKKVFVCWLCILLIFGVVVSYSYTIDADDTLVVRTASDYNIDFSTMCFADYCMFFVQDINIKYGIGHNCGGNGRSGGILDYGSLQDLCLNELAGGDNGIDCSALVYIIGKYFGSSINTSSTSAYESLSIGSDVERIIDAKERGFDEIKTGDVIITKKGDQGHALICVGEVAGEMSMVHIGSSFLCTHEDRSRTCCTIVPGSGVNFCDACTPNVTTSSGQNKRFIRTAAVNTFFSDMSGYDSVKIYRPFYSRNLGDDYTGTDYGSGASSSTIVSWVQKTGTMLEESEIIGMPGKFVFDGEPIIITGRDGLSTLDKEALTSIGQGIGYGKITISSIITTIVTALGYILLLYGSLLIMAYFFDCSNNFIDMSLMSILTFNKWRVVDDEDVKKTLKRNGITYITKTGVFVRAGIVWVIGILFVSGTLLKGIAFVLDKIYEWVG